MAGWGARASSSSRGLRVPAGGQEFLRGCMYAVRRARAGRTLPGRRWHLTGGDGMEGEAGRKERWWWWCARVWGGVASCVGLPSILAQLDADSRATNLLPGTRSNGAGARLRPALWQPLGAHCVVEVDLKQWFPLHSAARPGLQQQAHDCVVRQLHASASRRTTSGRLVKVVCEIELKPCLRVDRLSSVRPFDEQHG